MVGRKKSVPGVGECLLVAQRDNTTTNVVSDPTNNTEKQEAVREDRAHQRCTAYAGGGKLVRVEEGCGFGVVGVVFLSLLSFAAAVDVDLVAFLFVCLFARRDARKSALSKPRRRAFRRPRRRGGSLTRRPRGWPSRRSRRMRRRRARLVRTAR